MSLKTVIKKYYSNRVIKGEAVEKTAERVLTELQEEAYYLAKLPHFINYAKSAVLEIIPELTKEQETKLSHFFVNTIMQEKINKQLDA